MPLANPITTLILIALTLLSVLATIGALKRLRHPERPFTASFRQRLFVAIITLTTLGLFIRFWLAGGSWQPVTSHRDGLLLMSFMLAGTIFFIQNRARLVGLSAFALPVLTFVLTWAICASGPTYHPFDLPDLHPVWRGAHLTGVYLGTTCCGIAAMAGGMYLYVQARLKRKDNLGSLGRLASLEALENLIIRTATTGFILLTLGLVSGAVVVSEGDRQLPPGWWFAPKIVLASLAWGVYALLMNVRYASGFRGRRAAWLSIVGLTLLLATYVVVTSLPMAAGPGGDEPNRAGAPDAAPATAPAPAAPAATAPDAHPVEGR
jgi:ABC-type uncharacterized transport system permease subunit